MDSFSKLVDAFRQFPGVGPRQAKRFVHFLLSRDASFAKDVADFISALKRETAQCSECFRFFAKPKGKAGQTRGLSASCCPLCVDPNRATGELMVVARDTDLDAMEKSGTYHGKYFVLGGTMAPSGKNNADALRLKKLALRVGRDAKTGVVTEVILALSANPDGEHTGHELRRMLSIFSVQISTLGRGLSTGSELEYADKDTLASAFKNRSVSAYLSVCKKP